MERKLSTVRFYALFAGGLWASIFVFAGAMNLVYGNTSGRDATAMGLALATTGAADIPAMLLLVAWVRRKVDAFRRLVTALPACDAGGAARCRNCGAALPARNPSGAPGAPRTAGALDEPDGRPPAPASDVDVRRCAWCGVENLVTPETGTSSRAAPAPDLAERIRRGAPQLPEVEARTYEAVESAKKAAMYLAVFLFVPDSLVFGALLGLWVVLLGGCAGA